MCVCVCVCLEGDYSILTEYANLLHYVLLYNERACGIKKTSHTFENLRTDFKFFHSLSFSSLMALNSLSDLFTNMTRIDSSSGWKQTIIICLGLFLPVSSKMTNKSSFWWENPTADATDMFSLKVTRKWINILLSKCPSQHGRIDSPFFKRLISAKYNFLFSHRFFQQHFLVQKINNQFQDYFW